MDRYYVYALLDPRRPGKFKYDKDDNLIKIYNIMENVKLDGYYSDNVNKSVKNGKPYKGLFWKKYKNN